MNPLFQVKRKVKSEEESSNYQDPIKWFGYLVPQALQQAQARFKNALIWAAKSASIQSTLNEYCGQIEKLRAAKSKLLNTEE